ncbi:MAG: hypothetical protein JWO94_324 [Verrucomicrobiaceae bacterium]|nr:hypothetical protein [Verrucomicrobiaceae bacterium]
MLSLEGARWIGTGHDEGGVEKIEHISLTVDGKACALTDKAAYQGHRATLEKQSMLGSVKLQATYVVTDDAILERHRYEATDDVRIDTLYAFMHPWVPHTSEWMAELPDHSVLEGKFDSGGGYHMQADPKWTAVYDPISHRVALAWYPVPLAGQGLKSTYRDKAIYHKLYNQICSHMPFTKGSRLEAAVIVRGVESSQGHWKQAARSLASATAADFASGKLHV